jgi:hypothetical protein
LKYYEQRKPKEGNPMKLKARVREVAKPAVHRQGLGLPPSKTVRAVVDIYLPDDHDLCALVLADLIIREGERRCITIGEVEKTPEVKLREEARRLRAERNKLLRERRGQ